MNHTLFYQVPITESWSDFKYFVIIFICFNEIIRVKHRVHVLWEKFSWSDPVIQGVVKRMFFSPSRIMNNNGLIQRHTYGSTNFAFQVSHLWKWSTQLTCLKARSKCSKLPGWRPGTKPEDPVIGNWLRSSLVIDGCSLGFRVQINSTQKELK